MGCFGPHRQSAASSEPAFQPNYRRHAATTGGDILVNTDLQLRSAHIQLRLDPIQNADRQGLSALAPGGPRQRRQGPGRGQEGRAQPLRLRPLAHGRRVRLCHGRHQGQ